MAEREKEVVYTDGGGGSGGIIAAVVLVLVVAALLFFFFGRGLIGGSSTHTIKADVNVSGPKT